MDGLFTGWQFYKQTINKRVAIHVKKYRIDELPLDNEEQLTQWVYDMWARKEQLMQQVQDQGKPWRMPAAIKQLDEPMSIADWYMGPWEHQQDKKQQ